MRPSRPASTFSYTKTKIQVKSVKINTCNSTLRYVIIVVLMVVKIVCNDVIINDLNGIFIITLMV